MLARHDTCVVLERDLVVKPSHVVPQSAGSTGDGQEFFPQIRPPVFVLERHAEKPLARIAANRLSNDESVDDS